MENKLAIGSDHAGFELKEFLKINLKDVEFVDKGCYSNDRVDYPDFAHAVAEEVAYENVALGILICGSGNGISMSANKHESIRAALCWTEEIAELARQHNDANIISLPARFISSEEALNMVKKFLSTDFEGGRHANRIAKINC